MNALKTKFPNSPGGAARSALKYPPQGQSDLDSCVIYFAVALPKKHAKRRRRSDSQDKQALKTIEKIAPSVRISGIGTVSQVHSLRELTPNSEVGANDHKIPLWEDTMDRMKLAMAMRSLLDQGYAFTLNFGPKTLAAAQKSPKGFCCYVAERLRRCLHNHLGMAPMFCFAVDVAANGKLHIHGAIEATKDTLPQIAIALMAAGGKGWAKARYGETQVHFRELYRPTGWCTYSLEDRPKVRKLIRGRTVFISNRLRTIAKLLHLAMRRVGSPNVT